MKNLDLYKCIYYYINRIVDSDFHIFKKKDYLTYTVDQ